MPLFIHPRDRPAREAIGQHSHEAAAARRQCPPGKTCGRHRPFDEVAVGKRAPRMARTLRPAIMIVDHGRDARRIGIALFGEHRVRPRRARIDREARRTIAAHLRSAEVFEDGPRLLEVRGEFVRRHIEHAFVIVTVAGKLVPRRDDALDQRGIAFGNPPQGEEGPRRAGVGENPQHRVAIRLDAAFERRPVGAVDRALKGADLEPVLDIDRQAVLHFPSPSSAG